VGGVTEREAHIVYLLDGSGSVSESESVSLPLGQGLRFSAGWGQRV
jgi:hypothetical protein